MKTYQSSLDGSMKVDQSRNKVILSHLEFIPNKMITTTTYRRTTTVTMWNKIPVSAVLQAKDIYSKDEASSITTRPSTLNSVPQSLSTVPGASTLTSSPPDRISTSTSANTSTRTSEIPSSENDGLETVLHNGSDHGSMSTLTLALAIGIPAGIVLLALMAILYWYRKNCRNKQRKENVDNSSSWKKNPFDSYSEDEFGVKNGNGRSFGSNNWDIETKGHRSVNDDTPRTGFSETRLAKYETSSSGSLSTFDLCKNKSRGELGEKNTEKMDGMYENYRIRHMAPIQRLLVKTPGTALRKFFDRKSQQACLETINSTPMEEKLPKPKKAALRSLRLVNRLHELKDGSGSYSSNKENRDPEEPNPLPIRKYRGSRIVGDVPEHVYRKAEKEIKK